MLLLGICLTMTLANSVQVIAGQVSGTLFNVESARLVELETKVRGRLAASPQCSATTVSVNIPVNSLSKTVCPAFSCFELLFDSPHVSYLLLVTVTCCSSAACHSLLQAAENGEAQATKPDAKQTARDAALRARDASRTLQALPSEVRSSGLRV